MTTGFRYDFVNRYPENTDQQSWGKFKDKPLIDKVIGEAVDVVSGIEQLRQLPERNQKVLLDMAGFMIRKDNGF